MTSKEKLSADKKKYVRKKIKFNIILWTLSLTWGIIITAVGLLTAFILTITGHKGNKNEFGYIHFIVGDDWGGVNLGPVFITCRSCVDSIKYHEMGHGIQNILFGPLFPFIIAIPSAIRYWYREIIFRINPRKYWTLPDYDSIWFEGQATRLGDKLSKRYF